MKTQRKRDEDILFQSLDKIFSLYGGEIQFDEIVHWVLVRVTNEMLNGNDYSVELINNIFRRALNQSLNFKKENINKEIQEINKLIKANAKTH